MKRLRLGAVLHFLIAIGHVGCLFALDEAFEAYGIRVATSARGIPRNGLDDGDGSDASLSHLLFAPSFRQAIPFCTFTY